MATFDAAADSYQKNSLVQQQAAAKLIGLLALEGRESLLDVACGPGHLTHALRSRTTGRVLGCDVSPAMVREAQQAYPDLEFQTLAAEDLAFDAVFDVVFCNSALQWFQDPEKVLAGIWAALRPGGRLGLACPGTLAWTPFFLDVLKDVAADPGLSPLWRHWQSPWFILPTVEDYRTFFENPGFLTRHLEVAYECTDYSLEQAWAVYLSGAANGFIDPKNYSVPIDAAYLDAFQACMRAGFERRAENGRVRLDFNRLYYVGMK
jgi:trans-aconitate methyltransferase